MSVPLLSVQKGSYGPASTLISCKLLFVLGLPARLQGVPRLPHPRCCGAGELCLLLLARADEGPGGAGSQQPPLSQHGNNSGVWGRVVAARGAGHAWPRWLHQGGLRPSCFPPCREKCDDLLVPTKISAWDSEESKQWLPGGKHCGAAPFPFPLAFPPRRVWGRRALLVPGGSQTRGTAWEGPRRGSCPGAPQHPSVGVWGCSRHVFPSPWREGRQGVAWAQL